MFEKTLVLFVICSKCDSQDENIYKEEECIEMLNIVGLIKNV